MKILILTPGMFPDSHSGIPKGAYYLSRELRRMGEDNYSWRASAKRFIQVSSEIPL